MAGPNKIEEQITSLWEYHQKLTKNSPSFTSAVRNIIYCPYNERNKDNYVSSLKALVTGLISVYPANETELVETSTYLCNTLDSSSSQSPNSIRSGIKALFVADILLYQTSLPLEKRFVPKGWEKYKKEALRHVRPADTLPAEEALQLRQSIDTFKQTLVKELEAPEDKENVRIKAGITAELLSMHTDYLFNRSESLGSPEFQEWWYKYLWKKISNVIRSAPVYELFVAKQLEDMDDSVKIYVWGAQWEEITYTDHINAKEKISKLCEYFLDHPFLPKYFLGHFKPYRLDRPDQEDLREPKIFDNLPDYFLSELYLQPANVIYDLLSAIPIKELGKSEQIAFFKSLLGESGLVFYALVGYDDNKAIIIEQLQQVAADLGINSALSEEFDILADKKPGAIQLLFLHYQTRTVIPKKGQTREEFVDSLERSQEKKANIFAYVSKAWSDVEKPKEVRTVKDTFSIAPSETQWTRRWGEVQIPRQEDISSILDWLGNKATSELDPEKLLDLAASYSSHLTTADNIVLLTTLLPQNHPLSPLKKMGVIAVEQDDDKIQFLIDAKTAKIEVEGTNEKKFNTTKYYTFILQGTMQNGDLIIDGAKEDFLYTPLYLLLTAAEFFRRKGFIEEGLSKDERSQVHQLVKSWKFTNKGNSLPSIDYADPGKRNPNGALALYPLSEKTVLLNLH